MNERDKLARYDRVVAENERLREHIATTIALLDQPVYGHTNTSDNACRVMRADAELIRDRGRAALAACEVRS